VLADDCRSCRAVVSSPWRSWALLACRLISLSDGFGWVAFGSMLQCSLARWYHNAATSIMTTKTRYCPRAHKKSRSSAHQASLDSRNRFSVASRPLRKLPRRSLTTHWHRVAGGQVTQPQQLLSFLPLIAQHQHGGARRVVIGRYPRPAAKSKQC
jgi:hypothetical protein